MSKRTINEHISRAKAIPGDIRAIIKGTKLDTAVYLDSLKDMEPKEKQAQITADLAEAKKPKPKASAQESLERLKRGWREKLAADDAWEFVLKAATTETRSRIYAWQNDQEADTMSGAGI